jgi:hypothetical protein
MYVEQLTCVLLGNLTDHGIAMKALEFATRSTIFKHFTDSSVGIVRVYGLDGLLRPLNPVIIRYELSRLYFQTTVVTN